MFRHHEDGLFQKIILPWVSSRDLQWVNKTSKPGPFPNRPKPLFQNEANFKWFSFLLQITQEKFLQLENGLFQKYYNTLCFRSKI